MNDRNSRDYQYDSFRNIILRHNYEFSIGIFLQLTSVHASGVFSLLYRILIIKVLFFSDSSKLSLQNEPALLLGAAVNNTPREVTKIM